MRKDPRHVRLPGTRHSDSHNLKALREQGYHYERLDQLTNEILLGIR